MAQTTVQRYQLNGNDSIKLSKDGSVPMLEVGNYHFSLPTNQTELQKVVDQFKNINWSTISTGSTTNQGF